jgi:hypothetical protein
MNKLGNTDDIYTLYQEDNPLQDFFVKRIYIEWSALITD